MGSHSVLFRLKAFFGAMASVGFFPCQFVALENEKIVLRPGNALLMVAKLAMLLAMSIGILALSVWNLRQNLPEALQIMDFFAAYLKASRGITDTAALVTPWVMSIMSFFVMTAVLIVDHKEFLPEYEAFLSEHMPGRVVMYQSIKPVIKSIMM